VRTILVWTITRGCGSWLGTCWPVKGTGCSKLPMVRMRSGYPLDPALLSSLPGQRGAVAAWCRYLEGHARRLYATVTDRVRVAAALLASRIARGRLASPFTAREVYRNDLTGLTEPRVVGEALACLRELGWIRPEAVVAGDGGRPTVRFHVNPRVASR
jgi:hypothetical protein